MRDGKSVRVRRERIDWVMDSDAAGGSTVAIVAMNAMGLTSEILRFAQDDTSLIQDDTSLI